MCKFKAPCRTNRSDTVLYDDDELRIRQMITKVLSRQRAVQLQLVIENYYPEPIEIELHYAPVLPGFVAAQPGQEMRLDRRLRIVCGRTVLSLLSLTVRLTTAAQAASISLPETGALLEKRSTQLRAQCEFQEEFHVVPDDPVPALRERLCEKLYLPARRPFAMRCLKGAHDCVGMISRNCPRNRTSGCWSCCKNRRRGSTLC